MKVNELIEKLNCLPQELEIMVSSGEYLDSAATIDEIIPLYFDEEGNAFAAEDAHQKPNAVCIYGLY